MICSAIIKNREVVDITEVKRSGERNLDKAPTSNAAAAPGRHVVKLGNTKYNYMITTSKELECLKKKYERHVDAWTVKGHTRTYKSGKTIYVKPFKKGSGEIAAKTYKI